MNARKSILAGLAAVLSCLIAAPAASAANPVATPLDTLSGNVRYTTPGPGNALWFTGPGGVSKMTAAGAVSHIAPLSTGFTTRGIAAGPDGNLWVSQSTSGSEQSQIVRVTPAGAVTEFSAGLSNGGIDEIEPGPDGDLWFTKYGEEYGAGDNGFGRITTSGAIDELHIPGSDGVRDFALGADGRVWFTDLDPVVGAISSTGEVEKWRLAKSSLDARLEEIISGPDGDIWFVQEQNRRDVIQIKRIDAEGNVSLVTDDLIRGSNIREMIDGGDGYAYAIDRSFGLIYRISPTGEVTAMTGGIDEKFKPLDIASGPGGFLWIPSLQKIWRLSPELESTTVPEVTIDPLQKAKIKTRKRRVTLAYDVSVDPADAELSCSTKSPGEGPYFTTCPEGFTYKVKPLFRGTESLGFSVLAEANGLGDPTPPMVVTRVTQNSPKGGKGGKG